MYGKGVAAAVVLLFVVTAARLGDKPVFRNAGDAEVLSQKVQEAVKGFHKSSKVKAYDY